jgi:hypothetical protein
MKKYINDIGCTAEFEDGIKEEVIQQSLNWLGKNWRKVEEIIKNDNN